MKKVFFCCLVTAVYISCSPSQKALDAKEDAVFNKWLHHSKAELVQAWGLPDSARADGKGGEVLIYKEGIDYKSIMNGKYTGKQYSVRKEMFINADSLIYYWKAWRRK
jgi:hypothetical protein